MLEAISSFAQAIANTLLLSRHGEAELLLGLIVGLAFVLDLARGRDHGGDARRSRSAPASAGAALLITALPFSETDWLSLRRA